MSDKNNELSRWRHAPSDAEWATIEPLMSDIQGGRGRPARDNRRFFHAVCWILQTGSPWRDLPADFGKWRSIHDRFLDWAKRGWWTKLFEKIRGPATASVLSLDSTIAKAAPCASGAQKRKKSPLVSRQRQARGRRRGCPSSGSRRPGRSRAWRPPAPPRRGWRTHTSALAASAETVDPRLAPTKGVRPPPAPNPRPKSRS